MRSADPLSFFDLRPYRERLAEAELNTGLTDAMVVGAATLDGHPLELAVMDFSFMGGSMGSAVGEKFVRACDAAIAARTPLLLVTELGRRADAGGDPLADAAAEDVASIDELHEARLPLFCVLTDPDDRRRDGELRDARRRDRSPSRARCSRSPARASCRRSSRRSSPTTSAAPSRTSASARSTPSSPDPSSGRTWRGSSGSLAGEAERSAAGAARPAEEPAAPPPHGVSGEERAAPRAARLDLARRRVRGRDLGVRRARAPPGPPVHARLRRADPRRLGRAARRPRPGRRRRDRRRAREARRPHGRARRAPEGPRPEGAARPPVRDAAARRATRRRCA